MSWPIEKIGDVCNVIPGYAFKSSDLGEEGIPVIKIGNITESNAVDIETVQRISADLITEKHKKYFLRNGDIVIAMTGATAGKVGRLRCADDQLLLLNQRVAKFCPEAIDPNFFWFTISTSRYRTMFYGLGGGAAQPNMSGDQIEAVEIPNPPLATQQRIASILIAYDDLIENNRRRIQLLEQAARLLYKEWFVHLRFPGHEHAKIKDGVPEGWEKMPFRDIVEFKEGPGLRNYQYRDQGVPFLNIRTFNDDEIDLSKTRCIDEMEVTSKYQHFLLDEDDHVVSSSGTLGRVVTIRKCHLPVMLNTSLIRMRPKGVMKKWFLKAYLKYGDFIDQATAMATGAAQLNFGPSHLNVMTVMVPNRQLIELFEGHVSASYSQIKLLLDCNLKLTTARDLLLPRLMNGEVAV